MLKIKSLQSKLCHIVWVAIAILVLTSGCASRVYRFGNPLHAFRSPKTDTTSPQSSDSSDQIMPNPVVVGGSHPHLDKLENVVHYPARKFKQWFGKKDELEPDKDELREHAIAMSQEYLALNQ